jgi:hypothetical protein
MFGFPSAVLGVRGRGMVIHCAEAEPVSTRRATTHPAKARAIGISSESLRGMNPAGL